MSLSAALDTSIYNSADPLASSPPEKREPADKSASSKPAVVLPTGQEIGLSPKRPTGAAKPKYEPKQWQGVSALYADEATSGDSPTPLAATVKAEAAKEKSMPIPSAREIGLVSRPTASKTQYEVKTWTGISNSMSDDGDAYHVPSPENERRRKKDAEKAVRGEADKEEVRSVAYPVKDAAVNIPSSHELKSSPRETPARRHSLSGPSPRASASANKAELPPWLAGSSFSVSGFSASEHGLNYQKDSPSPPARHAASSAKDAPATSDSKPAFSIPSAAELNLGPSSYRPRGRSRSISYEATIQDSTSASWGGVSAVLLD